MRCAALLLTLMSAVLAQATDTSPKRLPGYKLETPPVIDGVVTEKEWGRVPTVTELFDTNTGEAAPEKTTFWLAYDSKYVYFAGKMEDAHPQQISAKAKRSNDDLSGDDQVNLELNLDGTLGEWHEFSMNPSTGTSVYLPGGRAVKEEWRGGFISKGRVTDKGWEFEARIPWQMLFLPQEGRRTVRFCMWRYFPKPDRKYGCALLGNNNREGNGYWMDVDIPRAADIGLLKLLPYTSVIADRAGGNTTEGGLDMKLGLPGPVNLIGTVHPDFRNIENSILSLSFSRFDRLVDESRPFFLEGRDALGMPIYASQQIKKVDYGLNAYGKIGTQNAFGVLATQSHETGETNFVTHLVNRPNPFLTIDGGATYHDQEGQRNSAAALNINRLLGKFVVAAQESVTDDQVNGRGESTIFGAGFGDTGFGTSLLYNVTSPRFLPRLGFQPEVDFRGTTFNLNTSKNPKMGFFQSDGYWVNADSYVHTNGSFYKEGVNAGFWFGARDGIGGSVSTNQYLNDWGDQRTHNINLNYPRTDPTRNLGINYTWGDISYQAYSDLVGTLQVRPWKNGRAGWSLEETRHGSEQLLGIFSLNHDFDRLTSLGGRVVRSQRQWGGYLSYRRSGGLGTEYFIILGDPNAPRFHSMLTVKVAVPVSLRLW